MKPQHPDLFLTAAIACALILALPATCSARGRFSDVPPGHWAANAVTELAERGILRGYPPPIRRTKTAAPSSTRLRSPSVQPPRHTRSRPKSAPATRND